MLKVYMFIAVSIALFAIGIYGLITRRNILRMLLSAEVIFNGGLLALLSVASASPGAISGGVLALLAISLAAAEVGVIVSIAVLMFRVKGSIDVYELKKFKG